MSTPDYTRTEELLRAALTAEVDTTMTLTDTPREYERLTGRIRRSRRRTQLLAAAAVVAVIAAGTGAALLLRGNETADPGPATSPSDGRPQRVRPAAVPLPGDAVGASAEVLPAGELQLGSVGGTLIAWELGREEAAVRIDARTGDVLGTTDLSMPGPFVLEGITPASDGAVLSYADQAENAPVGVLHVVVDAQLRRVTQIEADWPDGVNASAVGFDGVWVATARDEIGRLGADGAIVERVPVPVDYAAAFAVAPEGIWVASPGLARVVLIDRSGRELARTLVPAAIDVQLVGNHVVATSSTYDLHVIDRPKGPATHTVGPRELPDEGEWGSLAVDDGHAYGFGGGILTSVDPAAPEAATVFSTQFERPAAVAIADRLWVLSADGTLTALEPGGLG